MAKFTPAPEETAPKADWSANVLAPLSEKETENAEFTSGDRIKFYDVNAADYDKDMKKYSFK